MTQQLDVMAIEPERRQTRPLAINIEFGSSLDALDDDYLRVVSIQGEESVSQLYHFNIELRANEDNPASADELDSALYFSGTSTDELAQGMGRDLIGKWAHLRVAMAYDQDRFTEAPLDSDPSWEDATPSRFFGGIITSVTHGAPGEYQLAMQPPLFLLTLRNRYYIYKEKTIEQLITALLAPETLNYNANFALEFKLDGQTVNRVQDWLQAGESDYAFLQRVLAKATIHFYFIHEQSKLTMVFSNKTTSLQEVDIPGCDGEALKLRYSYNEIKPLGMQQDDLFLNLQYQVKMVQQTVKMILTRTEAQWEQNSVAGFISYDKEESDTDNPIDYQRHRCYAYGTNLSETEGEYTKVRQQLATEEGTLTGVSTSPLLSPGYTFELDQPVTTDLESTGRMPAQFSGKTFVVTKITHKATDKESYTGTIEATEVDVEEEDTYKETLITPFDMQVTQQGSVLAQVLETAVPKGWRYREKANFQPQISSVTFDDVSQREMGCVVRFATDTDNSTTHWVSLSQGSQTVPEVGAMVLVTRDSNESELPIIQQVMGSHGQKTIQPADPKRRNNSWTANTSWGSNYSTSYGDGISIRYGSDSSVDLPQAINIVEDAYDNPGVLSTDYCNASYNKGSSFSFSVSDDGEDGLSNASVSAGCNFSESHSTQNYNVSFTNASQSYSKINKSVNVSYMGTFTDVIDEVAPSFVSGKIPEQSIITISDALPDGSSYNQSHITGKTINLSGTGVAPVSTYDSTATVYSNSKTVGTVISVNEQTGNTTSTSTTTGDTTSTSTITGKTTNTNTHTGNSKSTSTTNGNTDNTNTVTGNASNISTTVGNSSNINTTVGANSNINTMVGATSSINTNVSVASGIDITVGAKSNINLAMAANLSLSATTGVDLSLSARLGANINLVNNVGVFVNSEVCAGVKAELYTGPVTVRTVTQVEAELKTLEAKILSGIRSVI